MTNTVGAEQEFRDRLAEGKFGVQSCQSCNAYVFFPRVVCPECGGISLQWCETQGMGVVYSTTVVRRSDRSGGNYNIAIVELDDGPRMMSRVEGIAPEAVKIGLRVTARIVDKAGTPVVMFTPEGDTK